MEIVMGWCNMDAIKNVVIILGVLFSSSSCEKKGNSVPRILKWETADIAGWQYRLDSRETEFTLNFYSKGNVTCQAGVRGGPVAGVLFHWVISSKGELIISRGNESIAYRIELDSINEQYVLVRRNGEREQFEREKRRP